MNHYLSIYLWKNTSIIDGYYTFYLFCALQFISWSDGFDTEHTKEIHFNDFVLFLHFIFLMLRL